MNEDRLLNEIETLGESLADVRAMISRRIIGQDSVVELVLASILAGGHMLLVGVPGLGKTRLVECLGTVLGLETRRVQFTPDLMPADIIGSEILQTTEDDRRKFEFAKGPVFCQMLMADEINRASPRTQSALLQAMQEQTVTVSGVEHPLPKPFHVLATQNPIELEGTYPLPEAQLDRFSLRVNISYPERDKEREILIATTGVEDREVSQLFSAQQLLDAQRLVRQMPIGSRIVELILDVVRACRPGSSDSLSAAREEVEWGPGPRASQSLMLTVRARALINGRLAPTPEDVAVLAYPALSHRMALRFSSRAKGRDVGDLIDEAVARTIENRDED